MIRECESCAGEVLSECMINKCLCEPQALRYPEQVITRFGLDLSCLVDFNTVNSVGKCLISW